MGKGYAEGPAADEAERRRDDLHRGDDAPPREARPAVYGATPENSDAHFIGWLGEVDPDLLFASGAAWGITVRRRLL